MTKVCIVNDTTRFHFGSAEVMDEIHRICAGLGWEILASFFGNSFMFEKREPLLDHDILESADVILINGEGTIHHDQPMAVYLMNLIERYGHKKIALINTLWEEMGPESEAKVSLAKLIIARDPASHATLKRFYGGALHLTPDLSSRRAPPFALLQKRGVVYGTFYWNQHERLCGIDKSAIALKKLAKESYIDITRDTWRVTVNKLRHSDLLVTGKFHEVMAAIVANCPFVFCPVKTHKIQELGSFAGVPLSPLDLSLSEDGLHEAFEEAIVQRPLYNRIFAAIQHAHQTFDYPGVLRLLAES